MGKANSTRCRVWNGWRWKGHSAKWANCKQRTCCRQQFHWTEKNVQNWAWLVGGRRLQGPWGSAQLALPLHLVIWNLNDQFCQSRDLSTWVLAHFQSGQFCSGGCPNIVLIFHFLMASLLCLTPYPAVLCSIAVDSWTAVARLGEVSSATLKCLWLFPGWEAQVSPI